MKPLLALKEIEYAWPGQSRPLLKIASFDVNANECVLLKGPSGSGKSTLLNLIGGVLLPQKGSIKILDESLSSLSAQKRDAFRANHLGFIFQQFNLLPFFTALENVTLPAQFSSFRKNKVLEKKESLESEARRLMRGLKLDESLFDQKVTHLSVGQQQRVAAARALLGGPELLIADEPTSALDAEVRDRFLELLFQECRQSQTAVLFVSHDPGLSSHFDRMVSLSEINSGETS